MSESYYNKFPMAEQKQCCLQSEVRKIFKFNLSSFHDVFYSCEGCELVEQKYMEENLDKIIQGFVHQKKQEIKLQFESLLLLFLNWLDWQKNCGKNLINQIEENKLLQQPKSETNQNKNSFFVCPMCQQSINDNARPAYIQSSPDLSLPSILAPKDEEKECMEVQPFKVSPKKEDPFIILKNYRKRNKGKKPTPTPSDSFCLQQQPSQREKQKNPTKNNKKKNIKKMKKNN